MRQNVLDLYPEQVFTFADGLDEAIIGVDESKYVVCYDIDKIFSILMERDGMSRLQAEEYFDYNISGAYVGEQTPIYIKKINSI